MKFFYVLLFFVIIVCCISETILKNEYIESQFVPFNYSSHNLNTKSSIDHPNVCNRPVKKCIESKNWTCFGTRLPYTSVSFEMTQLTLSLDVGEQLRMWEAYRAVPKCWAVIQPLLCAVYLPHCELNNHQISIVSYHLCKATRFPCRIIRDENWPEFLRCNNSHVFSNNCGGGVGHHPKLRFNTSNGMCVQPLVPTEQSISFFSEIDECGMKCHSPQFNDHEYAEIRRLSGVACGTCCISAAFAVITFIIEWHGGWANKYPNIIIFYMNCCMLIVSLTWLLQFLPGALDFIVCRKDNTLRIMEPGSAENFSCVVVFILIYYFSVAAAVWNAILAYMWSFMLSSEEKFLVKARISKLTAYFHILAWCFPFILTTTVIFLNAIDGNALLGICFLGTSAIGSTVRLVFLLLPASLAVVATSFVCRGIYVLTFVRLRSESIFGAGHLSERLRAPIIRILVYTFLLDVFHSIGVLHAIYFHRNASLWDSSLREYVLCEANISFKDTIYNKKCQVVDRPSLIRIQLLLLSVFGTGILISSWVWTRDSISAWNRFIRRHIGKVKEKSIYPLNEDHLDPVARPKTIRFKKHAVIIRAYAKRHELQEQGRLSLTLASSHLDPIGMDINATSAALGSDMDSSGVWAAALPRLVQRRNAIVGDLFGITDEMSGHRRFSVDSQISSNFSNDLDRLQSIYDEATDHRKNKRHRSKSKFFSALKHRRRRMSSRSFNSQENSSQISQVLPAITLDPSRLTMTFGTPKSEEFVGKLGSNPAADKPMFLSPGFQELQARLDMLAVNSSLKTSQNTEDFLLNSYSMAGCHETKNVCSIGVQTLQKYKRTRDTGTQCDHLLDAAFKRHLEPNVISIIVPSCTTSSSSCSEMTTGKPPQLDQVSVGGGNSLVTGGAMEFHRRGRRGAMIDGFDCRNMESSVNYSQAFEMINVSHTHAP